MDGDARREQIVEVFRQRARDGLAPPTVRELCTILGLTSVSTGWHHLNVLVAEGRLVRSDDAVKRISERSDPFGRRQTYFVSTQRTITLPPGWWRDHPSSEPCGACGRR